MSVIAAGLDRSTLQTLLQHADPSALLVPQRILRRVIRKARVLPGMLLQVPHRKCLVIDANALSGIVQRAELGLSEDHILPERLLLLAEMEDSRLAGLPRDEVLRCYWRLLFHARVHAEMQELRENGLLGEARVRDRIARIGQPVIAAAAGVLRQENLLLPSGDPGEIYEEFAAVFLELSYFEPERLPHYFPLAPFKEIEQILSEDVDAASLYAQTRLEGTGDTAVAPETPAARPVPPELLGAEPLAPAAYARLRAAAEKSRGRGNLVRAALRSERAARAGDAAQCRAARSAASADLDLLMARLQKALDLPPSEVAVWRNVLDALLGPAAGGLWTAEGRLLYDLQKICLDAEREVYAVDFVEWFVTWLQRPLRRHLPHQRLVVILKHLRHAAKLLPVVRLSPEMRAPFHDLLHAAVRRGEDRIRDRFRPGARAALDGVGLTGHSRAEAASRDKIVEELLDRVVERDLLTMSDLRDAVARNRVKLPDLSGPGEFFLGDRLIRANRILAHTLDGVYRRGEIYLRWLQRGTSAAFGTRIGRAVTRFVGIPFGGAFILLEGFKAILHELPDGIRRKVEAGLGLDLFRSTVRDSAGIRTPRPHDTTWLADHLRSDAVPTLVLGAFLFGVLYVPRFRRLVIGGLETVRSAFRLLCIDLPASIMNLPAVRSFLRSWLFALVYCFAIKPLLFAAPVTLTLWLSGVDARDVYTSGCVVFAATALLLNSPLGSHVEELLADRLLRGWHLLSRDLLPGLYYLIVGVFRMLMERLERMMYAVDEWLRFRTGDSAFSAAVKPILGLVWFAIAYVVRFVINLFVEPTFNPIKHFPVVTVAAKLLLPFIPRLSAGIAAAVQPVMGVWLGGLITGALVFFIPGFAGFLVWELKENWRLYAANQPMNLQAEVVGSHGETVRRLLRPGFHSGTVPKIFAKLRHADGKAARKQEEALHHVADALQRFVERDFLAILERSPRWGPSLRLRAGEIALGTNCIRFDLRCRDVADPPLCIAVHEENGRLLAGIAATGWLSRLTPQQRRALADALAGFYSLAGINIVREEIEAAPQPQAEATGMHETGAGSGMAPPERHPPAETGVHGRPVAPEEYFSARPIHWSTWVEVWQQEPGQDLPHLVDSDRLLPRT